MIFPNHVFYQGKYLKDFIYLFSNLFSQMVTTKLIRSIESFMFIVYRLVLLIVFIYGASLTKLFQIDGVFI